MEVNFNPPPTVSRFMASEAYVRGLMGPYGCLRGDARVRTTEGLLPIARIEPGTRVLSYDHRSGRYRYALTNGAFRKGADYLYRVQTPHGVFVAAGHHRVLCEDDTYCEVRNLYPGQFVPRYSGDPSEAAVVAVERQAVKEDYWDMHVFGTHNYVTEDGTVHHNSGKSVGCVMELLRRAQMAPKGEDGVRRTRFVIIRNTYKMLHDTTLNTVFEWVPQGLAGKWVSSRNNYQLQFGDVDSLWMFRALDLPDDIRNLLSLEVTGAWINEYREIDPNVFVNLLGRVGRYRPDKNVDRGWFGIIMDTNPPPVDSFWYSLFEDEPSEEVQAAMARLNKGAAHPRPLLELYKQPSGLSDRAENIENLPEGYYDLLLAANADKSKEWTNVHIHGQYGYVQDGKPVFPEFSDANAAAEPLVPNPHQPIAIGRDFGLTPAAVAMQQTVDGRWFVLGELVADNCGEEQFVERLGRWVAQTFPEHLHRGLIREALADPAGQHRSQTDEKTCFQVLRANGWTVRPGPQDLETRLGSVRRVLNRMVEGRPGLLVDPSCRTLLKGFYGAYRYRRKKTSTEEYEEVPEKNDVSHPMDALQYVLGFYEGQGIKGRANRKFGARGLGTNKPMKAKQSWKPW